MNIKRLTQGFTLPELMISLVIGLIVIGTALSFFLVIFSSNSEQLRRQHLTQDLRSTMSIITHDLERASFWGAAETAAVPNATLTLSQTSVGAATATDSDSSNIFAATGADLVGLTLVGSEGQAVVTGVTDNNTITLDITEAFDEATLEAGKWGFLNPYQLVFPTNNTPSNCILFTYDVDRNNTIANNERFGYRLNANAVQMYLSGTFACDNGTWEDMTDTPTNVTSLQFTLQTTAFDVDGNGPGTSQVINREVDVSLEANLAADATISRSMETKVKIHNDLFVP